jgi:D-alanyl-D-alanine carboxypeptidase
MRSDVAVQQLIDVFKDKPFDFSPGEQMKYDNSGYVLLGAIIEQVSGQSYADFVRTQIFEPLAMKNTKVDDSRSLVHHRAAGYERRDDQWINADYLSMTHPYSAGALITNIDDLARWNAAIENHQLLPAALWERATSSFSLSDGTSTRYGGGWIMGRIGNLASIEHGGGINGFNAYVLRVPSKGLYVAVLANASPPRTPPQRVALNLATTALGTSLDTPEVPLDSKRLEQYVGTYQLASNDNRHVNRTGNRLFLVNEDEKRLELTPIGHDLFEAREDHSQVRFMRRNGRISALTVEQRILMRDRAPAQRVAQ